MCFNGITSDLQPWNILVWHTQTVEAVLKQMFTILLPEARQGFCISKATFDIRYLQDMLETRLKTHRLDFVPTRWEIIQTSVRSLGVDMEGISLL